MVRLGLERQHHRLFRLFRPLHQHPLALEDLLDPVHRPLHHYRLDLFHPLDPVDLLDRLDLRDLVPLRTRQNRQNRQPPLDPVDPLGLAVRLHRQSRQSRQSRRCLLVLEDLLVRLTHHCRRLRLDPVDLGDHQRQADLRDLLDLLDLLDPYCRHYPLGRLNLEHPADPALRRHHQRLLDPLDLSLHRCRRYHPYLLNLLGRSLQ